MGILWVIKVGCVKCFMETLDLMPHTECRNFSLGQFFSPNFFRHQGKYIPNFLVDPVEKSLCQFCMFTYLQWMQPVWKCYYEPLWPISPENVEDGKFGNAGDDK